MPSARGPQRARHRRILIGSLSSLGNEARSRTAHDAGIDEPGSPISSTISAQRHRRRPSVWAGPNGGGTCRVEWRGWPRSGRSARRMGRVEDTAVNVYLLRIDDRRLVFYAEKPD